MMTTEQIREVVLRALGTVAPEADPAALDATVELREQVDIDSMDFLNFVVAVHQELGADIPEADYPKITTLDSFVTYLQAALARTPH